MKCISVEEFTDDLRKSICWSNCHLASGCRNCNHGLSIAKIIELIEAQPTISESYLLDSSEYLPNGKRK